MLINVCVLLVMDVLILWTNDYYYYFRAPTTFGDRMAAGAVNSGFTTFANLFGTTPLLTNFFGHWLRV